MIFNRKIYLLTHALVSIVCLMAATATAYGAPPKVSAKLSAPAAVMGDKISLDVQVIADRAAKGRFPIFDGVQPDGYATLVGDTVELSAKYESGSIDLGSGRVQIDYKIPVQVFDSGFYTLPPIAYVSGRDTAFTDPLTLKIVPVEAQASDEISDYTTTLAPGEGSFFDRLPLWILEWWWLVLILLLAAAAVVLFLMRYKRVKLRKAAKPLPPYQEAMRGLDELKNQKLWENGREKEYYTRLIDILRRYISRRFEIHAMEMTSDQILDSVKRHERIKPYLRQFQAVLAVADFVKFANMRSTPEENIGAIDEVKSFVEATRPTTEEQKAEAEELRKSEPRQKTARWERRENLSANKKKQGKEARK